MNPYKMRAIVDLIRKNGGLPADQHKTGDTSLGTPRLYDLTGNLTDVAAGNAATQGGRHPDKYRFAAGTQHDYDHRQAWPADLRDGILRHRPQPLDGRGADAAETSQHDSFNTHVAAEVDSPEGEVRAYDPARKVRCSAPHDQPAAAPQMYCSPGS